MNETPVPLQRLQDAPPLGMLAIQRPVRDLGCLSKNLKQASPSPKVDCRECFLTAKFFGGTRPPLSVAALAKSAVG